MLKKNYKFFFLIFISLVIFYRSPYIFTNGRFYSLDLIYHLKLSSLNFIESILFIDFSARYINLISNISSIISSRFFELSSSQYVAVYLSFLIYILIIYLILFKPSLYFTRNYQRYLFAILFVVCPVMSFEIWLNAINLQVYLGLLTLILFFIIPESNNEKYIYFLLILISGLSGIYACALLPLYIFKFLTDKNKYNATCCLILFFCCCVQIYIIYLSFSYVEILIGRNSSLGFTFTKYEAISYTYNVFVRAFFGSTFPKSILSLIGLDLKTVLTTNEIKNNLFYLFIILLVICLIALLFLTRFLNIHKDKVVYYLVFAFLIISFVVIFGGLSDSLHGRYSSINGIILILICLKLFETFKSNFLKSIFLLLILSSIFFGILDFRLKEYIYYLDCIECPNWNEEVRKYNLDKNYQLNAWPYHINR